MAELSNPSDSAEAEQLSEAPPARGWRGGLKWVALGTWGLVIVVWVLHLRARGVSPTDSLQAFVDRLDGAWWAIPAYIGVYTVRPLVLFPASLLTIAGGVLFGPVVGLGAAVAGANLSALVAFSLGKVFSPSTLADPSRTTFVSRWSGRLRERSFATVMVMRLALLPFDLVNYAAGFLRVRTVPFLLATAIGSFPGALSFVLAGASVQRLDAGVDGFDPRVFLFSLLLFVVSIAIAKVVQRRDAAA